MHGQQNIKKRKHCVILYCGLCFGGTCSLYVQARRVYASLNVVIAVFLTTRHISRDCSLFKGKRGQVKPMSGQWLVKGTGRTNPLNLRMLLLSRVVQLHK